jgi:hypothetical protein
MMSVVGAAPSPIEAVRFRKALKVELPADYEEFLLKYNGGVPLGAPLDVSMLEFSDDVARFRGIRPQGDPFALRIGELGELVPNPQEYLVIADTQRENHLALCLSGMDFGGVYYVLVNPGKRTSGVMALQRCWRLHDNFRDLCRSLTRPITKTLAPDMHVIGQRTEEEKNHVPGLWSRKPS